MKATIAIIVLSFATLCHAAADTELVTFGDSLTDMGNRGASVTKPNVKFRETWAKQLAGPQMFNVPAFKPAGMSTYFGGTNYAVGGATTEYAAKLGSDRNRRQNLTQQVSKRYLNLAFNTDGVKKDALHIVVIGANEIMLASIATDQIFTKWAELDEAGVAIAHSTEGQI